MSQPGEKVVQFAKSIYLERRAELGNMSADPGEIHPVAVQGDQSLDVLSILRSPRYRLEDHQIFGSRDRQDDSSDRLPSRT